MRRFFQSCVAALALTIASTGLASPAGAATGFGDVDPDVWYTEPIAWLVSEGITTGTSPGCFSPTDQVTRGQIVTFMFRLDQSLGNTAERTEHPFEDVTAEYQDAPVGWAFGQGITTGTGETTFAPDASITRGDFAVLLWRYAGRPSSAVPHSFDDVARRYQDDAIAWLAATGITTGTGPTTFSPDGAMTRAEAATFLHRFMDQPIAVAVTSTSAPERSVCVEEYTGLLIDVGLTPREAGCVAPFLLDLDLGAVAQILSGERGLDAELIGLLSEILAADCVPTIARQAALIRALL